jgi:two-component system, NtrC family, sensor kinase
MNILHNAIDALESSYDPDGSPLPTITLETGLAESGWVRIRITDNGPGIAPEVKSRIFDPFFTTKPVGAGTGMGLAVSYQIIVERHQGQLTCHSHPRAGTTFTIEIPLQQVEAQPIRGTSSLLAASV